MPPKNSSETTATMQRDSDSDGADSASNNNASKNTASKNKHSFVDEETREMLYRSGYLTQTAGLCLISGSFLLSALQGTTGSPSYISELLFIAGGLIALIGILLSGVFLRISRKDLKQIIVGITLIGMAGFTATNIMGYVLFSIMFLGLGGVGLAMLLGKEAHCFEYKEGQIMMYLLPATITVSLVDSVFMPMKYTVSVFWFAALIVLTLFILKKMQTPLTKQPDSKES